MNHGAVVINNNMYLVGGRNNEANDFRYQARNQAKMRKSSIDKYDFATKTFVTVNSMYVNRSEFGICKYNDHSFIVAGGLVDGKLTDTSFMYNTLDNKIEDLGKLNACDYGLVLVNCLGTVYAVGGNAVDLKSGDKIEKFNPTTNNWEMFLSKLNIGRFQPRAIAHNEFIYVFGGQKYQHPNLSYRSFRPSGKRKTEDSVEKVNTLTGEVTLIESKMLVARDFFSICKINSDVFLMGGAVQICDKNYNRPEIVQSDVTEVFNLESEKFTEVARLPFKNYAFTASVLEIDE